MKFGRAHCLTFLRGGFRAAGVMVVVAWFAASAADINLLTRYPATLTNGDNAIVRARPWTFTTGDIFHLSKFDLTTATNLEIHCGAADLGIGHCRDGVVWALVIPREDGKMVSPATGQEGVSHVWMRFQPASAAKLFPPETVAEGGNTNLLSRMNAIARLKFPSAYHAGSNALIPDPTTIIADSDTPDGVRRFFIVITTNQSATYVAQFEKIYFKPPPPITRELAETTFDQLWDYFDFGYAMFVLRPEVNWSKLRDEYRPRAVACKTSDEFASVCAEMLQPLRDLHISLTIAGAEVPVYDRPRVPNANPPAHKGILGSLQTAGRLQWAVTSDDIGFMGIYGWDDDSITNEFPKALEQMRNTRGMVMDVRFNGGGNEYLAQQVAARFVPKEFTYAYSQFRDGPTYTNLSKKDPRKIAPLGPWRYEHPVILLIGQKCMSSAESFVGMMAGDPDVTTMGDRTCGSSGNPKIYKLPLDMTVAVPVWIDYKPDGKPLDENGFQPQVPFTPEPNAFAGKRDDLLTAALARLRDGH